MEYAYEVGSGKVASVFEKIFSLKTQNLVNWALQVWFLVTLQRLGPSLCQAKFGQA